MATLPGPIHPLATHQDKFINPFTLDRRIKKWLSEHGPDARVIVFAIMKDSSKTKIAKFKRIKKAGLRRLIVTDGNDEKIGEVDFIQQFFASNGAQEYWVEYYTGPENEEVDTEYDDGEEDKGEDD